MINSTEWVGIVHSTMPHYLDGLVDLTTRSRLLLAFARQKGRIKLNCSGEFLRWPVFYSLPEMEVYADGGVLDFGNHNPNKTLAVDWRGYIVTDSISIKQRAMNSGQQQIVNLYQQKQNNISQSIMEGFSAELYGNGSAVDRSERIHGLETFMGAEAGTTTAADKIAKPDSAYGLTNAPTDLGAEGGYWSAALATPNNANLATDWPDGNGSSEYDHMSPKLINWSSSNWGTGSTSWEDNSWRVIDAAIDWLSYTGGPQAKPDIISIASDMHRGYKNHQEAKTRINIPHKPSQDLGFSDILNHDGVGIQKDFDCPALTFYGINVDKMRICSLMPKLFYYQGPSQDPHSNWSYLFGTGFWGNVEFQPKFFAKGKNYA
jgi:hypothetical protein